MLKIQLAREWKGFLLYLIMASDSMIWIFCLELTKKTLKAKVRTITLGHHCVPQKLDNFSVEVQCTCCSYAIRSILIWASLTYLHEFPNTQVTLNSLVAAHYFLH